MEFSCIYVPARRNLGAAPSAMVGWVYASPCREPGRFAAQQQWPCTNSESKSYAAVDGIRASSDPDFSFSPISCYLSFPNFTIFQWLAGILSMSQRQSQVAIITVGEVPATVQTPPPIHQGPRELSQYPKIYALALPAVDQDHRKVSQYA